VDVIVDVIIIIIIMDVIVWSGVADSYKDDELPKA
jgi:hypothetical protein